MRTIAVMNQKGGSAKTTTAVNLAAALAALGKKVLVVDLDPQANATTWLGATNGKGVFEVLTGEKKLLEIVKASTSAGVDAVPGSAWLAGAERTLAGEVGSELVFRKALERLPEKWDVVLVDCPPAIGLLSISALAACGEVLIPCEAHTMALSGLAGLVQTLERVRERLNPKLTISGIVACRVDGRTKLSEEVVATLRDRFGKDVLRAVVRENVRLAEAPSFAKSIFDYDPKSTGAEDYAAVAKELLARDGGKRTQRAKRSRLG